MPTSSSSASRPASARMPAMLLTSRARAACAALIGLAFAPLGTAEESAAPAAAPAAPVYNIELVVFRATGAQGSPENWSNAGAAARNIEGDESPSGPDRSATSLRSCRRRPISSPILRRACAPAAPTCRWRTSPGRRRRARGARAPASRCSGSAWTSRDLPARFSRARPVPAPRHDRELRARRRPAGLNAPPGTAFTINESRRRSISTATTSTTPLSG